MDAGFTSKIRRLTLRHQNSRLALDFVVDIDTIPVKLAYGTGIFCAHREFSYSLWSSTVLRKWPTSRRD